MIPDGNYLAVDSPQSRLTEDLLRWIEERT